MTINNSFVNLDVPGSTGTGAAAIIGGLSFQISMIIGGTPGDTGEVVIEISGDGVHFAPATSVFPINNPPAKTLDAVALFARVRRVSGAGAASVSLGATATSLNLFGTLSPAPLDTSEHGPFKTIIVSGTYPRTVVIEGSNDGVSYDAVAIFSTQDSDVLTLQGTWKSMRIKPDTDLGNTSIFLGSGADPSAGLLRSELGTSDADGFGLDMIGIVHVRDSVTIYPPEISGAMNALIYTNGLALQAQAAADSAIASSVLKYAAVGFASDLQSLPAGVKQSSIEFNEGLPLNSRALFFIGQLFQQQTFDNTGHTLIQAAIGTFADPEKYVSKTAINNPANAGKTLNTPGDANLILLAPIGDDAPLLTFYSADDLNTVTAGIMSALLYYTTP